MDFVPLLFIRGKEGSGMSTSNRRGSGYGLSVSVGAVVMLLVGCVPLETVQKPTLREVRLGNVQGQITEDNRLRPGEVRAEVDQIDRSRREIHALTDGSGRRVIPYDIDRTHVVYHGWDYTVNDLESGDLIAYFPVTRDRNYVDTIRIEEPVQARPSTARRAPLPPRNDVVEGTWGTSRHRSRSV